MRKAAYICLIALLLSACANNAQAEKVDTPEISAAVTATTTTTVPSASTTTVSAEEKEIITSSTTIVSEESETSSETTESTTSTERENEAATSQTEVSVSDKTGTSMATSASVSESKPKVTTVSSAPKNDVTQGTTTTTMPKSTTKKQSSTTTTTAKPRQSSSTTTTTTAKPKSTTTTTKSREDQYLEEYWEILERHGWGWGSDVTDVTCLDTMVLNLKYSDTPPSYYESVGRGLKHDGTDYGKAKAVYKWMIANGHGSCVYYAMETYFVCKGIGLECAYGFATKNNWYGHTYSVVKVNGTWYVLDTQGQTFLDNSEPCTRMFDGNDKDMTPFKEDIWYDYDENGEYRDWTIS